MKIAMKTRFEFFIEDLSTMLDKQETAFKLRTREAWREYYYYRDLIKETVEWYNRYKELQAEKGESVNIEYIKNYFTSTL